MELLNDQQLFQRISRTLNQAAEASPDAFPIMLGAILLCGVVYGYFGYRIYRWALACIGAAAGGILAIKLLSLLDLKDVDLTYIRLSLAAIFALIGGIIAPKLFHLFTFLIGGSAIALALHPLVPVIPEPYGWLALIIGFAAGGFMAFALMRPTLITATAVAGTYICAVTLFVAAVYFKLLPPQFNFMLFQILWGILALGAIVIQFKQKTPDQIDRHGQPTA